MIGIGGTLLLVVLLLVLLLLSGRQLVESFSHLKQYLHGKFFENVFHDVFMKLLFITIVERTQV
jgi:predicted PurR-regulated permease PerM